MRLLAHRFRLRGDLWRNRDFMWLWAAQTVSQVGSQISSLAIPLVAILTLDASTFQVSVLVVVGWAPFFLFSLPAGAWIDRLPRRPILVASDWGRALALASIPLAYFLDAMTLAQLYVVELVVGLFTVFFDLSYQSYLPSVVEREELGEGNAKLEVSRSAAQVAGPGLAGVLIRVLTAPYAILADAVSFVASALFLSRIERPEPKPKTAAERSTRLRDEIGEGLRFVLRHPLLRPIVIFVGVSNIFVNMLFAIYLVYAVRELDLSAATIGLIFSLGNIGTLVGALTATRLARTVGIGPGLITATIGSLGLLLIPLARGDVVIPFLVVASLLWGYFVLTYYVNAITLIQAITPDHLLGRTNASRRFLVQGVIPFGALLGGALGTTLGLRPAIAIGAVGACLAVLPLFFSPLRQIKETSQAEELVRPYNESFSVRSTEV
ncbi:MAG: MFS transporter [Gemmatimonadetes bacterium]|nr:MFS transporter [Gemmatimonadota bacterium]